MHKQHGFTLIELLVVVLIIGLLAAIALPQYEVAVAKSRLATILPIIKSVKEAQERYYMANGSYTDSLLALDIEIPPVSADGQMSQASGWVIFANGTAFDNLPQGETPGREYIQGGLRKKGETYTLIYHMWYDHSPRPGLITCDGTDKITTQICKSMGF